MTQPTQDETDLGARILRQAAELAFPRYPGTEGDARAITMIEARLRALGLETSVEDFSYDIRPAFLVLRALLLWGAVAVATVGLMVRVSPLAAAILLGLALMPGVIFLAWSPWLERLYQRSGPTRTANVVGRRRVSRRRLTLIVMAHHDSKSQSLTLPVRAGATMLAIGGSLDPGGAGGGSRRLRQRSGTELARSLVRARRGCGGSGAVDHEERQQLAGRCGQRGVGRDRAGAGEDLAGAVG